MTMKNDDSLISAGGYSEHHEASAYLKYMNENACTFEKNTPEDPYRFTMFSILSQHVRGDSVQECIDKAIEKKGLKL